MSLDELIKFDIDIKEIQEIIDKTDEKIEKKVDWTKTWGKKYPILIKYQSEVSVKEYEIELNLMLEKLKEDYNYSDVDSVLVLKDILYKTWKKKTNK